MSHENTCNTTTLETLAFSTQELSLDTFYEGAHKALQLRHSLELRAALAEAKSDAYDYVGYARKNALLAMDISNLAVSNALIVGKLFELITSDESSSDSIISQARDLLRQATDNAQKSRDNALIANNNAQRAIDDIRLSFRPILQKIKQVEAEAKEAK